jgi:hypothetical protein
MTAGTYLCCNRHYEKRKLADGNLTYRGLDMSTSHKWLGEIDRLIDGAPRSHFA